MILMAGILQGEKAFIENKDVPAFCQELLPVIQKFFKCKMVQFNPEDYGMIKPEFEFYLDAPQSNMLTCKATVKYGEREFSLYTTDDITMRDMNKETVVRNLLHKYFNAFNPYEQSEVIAYDEELEYEFLTEGVPALQAIGEVFISEELKAGGTGLNLTAADIVIHFDPWWNLAVQNQATDRAHRIGQKNVVNVYKLIVKDTIEENIMKLQEKKRELADQILEGENLNGSSLTREELVELLTGK